MPTRADTCDANHMNFIWMLICADMCQHLKKCRHLGRCQHVPARADTSRCRHVPTPVVLIIWISHLQTGMCWHVSAPEKVPTPGKMPTRADTCHANHMNFIWMLICADMCQHLKKGPTPGKVRTRAGTCRHI